MKLYVILSLFTIALADGQFETVNNITAFDPRIMGRWMGRTAMDANHSMYIWDLHVMKEDGRGILNKLHRNDSTMLEGAAPDRMWGMHHDNTVDHIIKAQYGPDDKGLMLCMDLQIVYGNTDRMLVKFNPVLFTNPVSAKQEADKYSCISYFRYSTMEGYSVAFDRLSNPSEIHWKRTTKAAGSGDFPSVEGDPNGGGRGVGSGIDKRSVRF